jgi:hypothetical protein
MPTTHDPHTCPIDLCPDCPPSCEAEAEQEAEYDDSAFGYTPGEDRSPAEEAILRNDARLSSAAPAASDIGW